MIENHTDRDIVAELYDDARVYITRAALYLDIIKNQNEAESINWWEKKHDDMHALLVQAYMLVQGRKPLDENSLF